MPSHQTHVSGRSFARFGLLCLPLLGLACGGGGSSDTQPASAVLSVVQDLDLDPEGLTTVLSFDGAAPADLAVGNFESSGAQSPASVSIDGNSATVVWDARVTPSFDVRVVGEDGLDSSFVDVTTTDPDAPTFAIQDGTQGAGLGDDSFEVVFSGAHIVPEQAEDIDNWELRIDGEVMDLTGSTIDFDAAQQTALVTLGSGTGLHASFELVALDLHSVADVALDTSAVAGSATGDAVAPTLLSAEMNLGFDDTGRVVDFTFDQAMDPFFSNNGNNFVVGFPVFPMDISQPSPEVLRVTFNSVLVPGIHDVDLYNLVDSHGNALGHVLTPLTADPVAQDFASQSLVTVQNAGGDYLEAEFAFGLYPIDAVDPAKWVVEVGGLPVDISGETLSYDVDTKTLTIPLPGDYENGDSFYIAGASPYSVDGTTFSGNESGTAAGDVALPTLVSLTQNRAIDPSGLTYDLLFSEDMQEAATEAGSFSASAGNVVAAELQADGRTLRLTTDTVVLPGSGTFDLGAVPDLAGNAFVALVGQTATSTDVIAPTPSGQLAFGEEGPNNDTLTVSFDDAMYAADVEDPSNWHFQSPIGVLVDTSLASVVYDTNTHQAVLTFDGGDHVNLQTRTDFLMSFANMHDIGGNALASGALYGVVNAETNTPRLISVWQPLGAPSTLHLRFSEPVSEADDIAGLTSYLVRDNGGQPKGVPGAATLDSDEMGVELDFGFAISAGSDTLDARGVLDLAGNQMFPALAFAIDAEDANAPLTSTGSIVAVAGETNDQFTIVFDRTMSPWGIENPDYYRVTMVDGITSAVSDLDLSQAHLSFDGDRTVTIDLDYSGAPDLQTINTYQVGTDGDGLMSAQGVVEPFPNTFGAALPSGDTTAPDFTALRVMLDAQDSAHAVILELTEAINADDAVDSSLVDIASVNPDTLEYIGPRTVRATFSGGVSAGQTINFDVHDLAGNLGSASAAIQAMDASHPVIASATAAAVPGQGGDLVTIVFDEPVNLASALDASNYAISQGANVFDLSQASLRYASTTNTLTIELPAGQDLAAGVATSISADNVYDLSGNTAGFALATSVATGGDVAGPTLADAFVNYREDAGGLIVDVLFSEDVDTSDALALGNWSGSGGQTVVAAEMLRGDLVRLTLSSALAGADTLDAGSLSDPATNVSVAQSIDPNE